HHPEGAGGAEPPGARARGTQHADRQRHGRGAAFRAGRPAVRGDRPVCRPGRQGQLEGRAAFGGAPAPGWRLLCRGRREDDAGTRCGDGRDAADRRAGKAVNRRPSEQVTAPVTREGHAMLTEEQQMIRDMARDFARERLAPGAAERDRSGQPPLDLLREMGRLGLMGMGVPEEWDGAGADFVAYVLALEEIAAGDGAVSTIMSVNNSPVCAALLRYGSQEQKERYLKPLARGEWIGAFCLTEPQAGSDASALRTRARRDGDKWVINGVKQFITSGSIARVALVFAVTDPGQGKRGISCFVVPTDTPGYKVASVESKLGQHCSDT